MNLFNPLNPEMRLELENLGQALDKTLKPRAAHLKKLPYDIAELSFILTEGRDELVRPYWSEARLKAAYLWYFMPWNLVRLAPLVAGLPLGLKEGDKILDLGSGPLTLPLVLWFARPDLRAQKLSFYCNDTQITPLQSGLDLFNQLAGEKNAWEIRFHKGSLNEALKRAKGSGLALISALNVLNEIRPGRQEGLAHLVAGLVGEMKAGLAPEGDLLLVEPGNRLGGKIIELAREAALKRKLFPASPCPHSLECPMLSPAQKTWCHFINEHPQAPDWLTRLSQAAGLDKTHTALSFVLLNAKKKDDDKGAAGLKGRIVSNPFKVPGQPGLCRYSCTSGGLVLVPGAERLASGKELRLEAKTTALDAKTGLRIATAI